MKYKNIDKQEGWRLSFAFLPITIKEGNQTTTIWLERYWSRFEGLYTNIRLYEDIPFNS